MPVTEAGGWSHDASEHNLLVRLGLSISAEQNAYVDFLAEPELHRLNGGLIALWRSRRALDPIQAGRSSKWLMAESLRTGGVIAHSSRQSVAQMVQGG